MISYEFAKELKEAGYPQDLRICMKPHRNSRHDKTEERETWPYPDHPELIEACGDRMEALIRRTGECVATQSNPWSGRTKTSKGAAPDEEVARLWIALNRSRALSLTQAAVGSFRSDNP